MKAQSTIMYDVINSEVPGVSALFLNRGLAQKTYDLQ